MRLRDRTAVCFLVAVTGLLFPWVCHKIGNQFLELIASIKSVSSTRRGSFDGFDIEAAQIEEADRQPFEFVSEPIIKSKNAFNPHSLVLCREIALRPQRSPKTGQ